MPDVGYKRIYRLGGAYAAAVVGPILVGTFRHAIAPWADDKAALVFFTLPVAVAASLGGIRPGIIASILGLTIGTYFFVPQFNSFTIADTGSAVNVLAFTFTWLFISLGGDMLISRRRDIRKSEALRSESESRLTTLLLNISDGFYVIDRSRRITLVNQALLTQLGARDSDLIGRTIDEVFGLDDPATAVFERALTSGEPEIVERSANGQTVELRLLPDPKTHTMAVFVHDVTLIKQLQHMQSRLLQQERVLRSEAEEENRRKDDFVATLSHELRTPMTSIIGWAEILRERAKTQPELLEGVDAIEKAARLQTGLIDDLLDLSRIVTGQLKLHREVLDLGEAVGEVVHNQTSVAQGRGCHLHWEPPEGEVFVLVDPIRLAQIVANLLTNSVKFTDPGGSIWVRVRAESDEAVIEVEDTGQGIDPELLPHIFDRFRQGHSGTTRRHGGLGLGLAIVQKLVEEHGGSISVASDGVGRGACFTVRLPLTTGLPPEARPRDEEDLEGVRVLVVEDDDMARRVIQELCTMRGGTVRACSSAREALSTIEAFGPDVIVSDIGMPDMDGYQFVRQLRSMPEPWGRLPAIALTAFARAEDRDRALRAGFDLHLAKPIESSQLVAAICRLITPP